MPEKGREQRERERERERGLVNERRGRSGTQWPRGKMEKTTVREIQ